MNKASKELSRLPENADIKEVIKMLNKIVEWINEEDIASFEIWQDAFKEAARAKGIEIY